MKITRTTATFSQSVLCLLLLLSGLVTAQAQTTQFTYQGRLTDSSLPANGTYDFQFALFNAVTAGTQVGSTVSLTNINVSSGNFTVTLDFGAGSFPGTSRFLQISVRLAGGGAFTTLSPRQPVTSTPYAIQSLNAAVANTLSATCNACVTSTQIGSLPSGNGNYIQNGTTLQASSNFNIRYNSLIGGRHGIGTTSPIDSLHVVGQGTAIRVTDGAVSARLFTSALNSRGYVGTATNHPFTLRANDTDYVTLTPSGNVGVGVIAPSARLEVLSTTGISDIEVVSPGGFFPVFSGRASRGTLSAPTATQNNDSLALFGGRGFGATSFGFHTAFMEIQAAENWTNAAQGTRMVFKTTTTGTAGAGERMRIDHNGNVGIGTTAPAAKLHVSGGSMLLDNNQAFFIKDSTNNAKRVLYAGTDNVLRIGAGGGGGFTHIAFDLPATADVLWLTPNGNIGMGTVNPADKLQVLGDIRVGTGSTGCVKDADGTVIAGVCSSDLRFKKEVTPLAKLLPKFAQLQPVNFFWRATEFPNKHFGTKESFGLIAQEVEAVLPELVTTDEQGYKAVNYSKLPLLTIQAVKELKAENDDLKTRLGALELLVKQLKAQAEKQAPSPQP